jgi:hypothetical protein
MNNFYGTAVIAFLSRMLRCRPAALYLLVELNSNMRLVFVGKGLPYP